jgi:hypothetical protein
MSVIFHLNIWFLWYRFPVAIALPDFCSHERRLSCVFALCGTLKGMESKETLKEVNHPNIAMIHAIEEIDGEISIVMEFIDG